MLKGIDERYHVVIELDDDGKNQLVTIVINTVRIICSKEVECSVLGDTSIRRLFVALDQTQ